MLYIVKINGKRFPRIVFSKKLKSLVDNYHKDTKDSEEDGYLFEWKIRII